VVAASSPGWLCAALTPGSPCTYTIGTVPAQTAGSLALAFSVIVDSLLDPTVNSIDNLVTMTFNGAPTQGTAIAQVIVPVQRPTAADEGSEPVTGDKVGVNQLYLPVIQNDTARPEGRSSFKKRLPTQPQPKQIQPAPAWLQELFISNGAELAQ